VFAFSSLWFAHYCLAALQKLRTEQAVADAIKPSLAQITKEPTDVLPKPDVITLPHDDPNKPNPT
jgi:hypothetical protein